jgi:hypothetical protein
MTHFFTAPRRRYAFILSQWIALAIAAYCGWQGYELADRSRVAIEVAARWYAVALVLIAYFVWDGQRPHPSAWPPRVIAYIREHPAELALLALICVVGAFVRLFRYGTLPPTGYIILEEHIYGGIQWDVLHGARPYIYPIPTYLGALSQWMLGPSTHGLRAYTIAIGIITVPLFYLMMREVVRRPAAIFATAIFASAHALSDIGPPHQTLIATEVLLVWFVLRSLNTGIIMWLVPAAVLAALLSFEYETAKALPVFMIPFLGWVTIRALLWPIPRSLATLTGRFRTMSLPAVKAVVAVTAIVIIVAAGPIIAENHRGRNIYFSSLERQKADRVNRGTPGLISPDWEKQLKFSAQVYTPWVDPDFPLLGSIVVRGVIDRLTSVLIWLGVISGVLFFWRGYRALFIGWFLGGMLMSSLLLSNWAAWKVVGWLPPAIALVGFVADDAFALAKQRGRIPVSVLTAACIAIAAIALGLNLRTLNANANDPLVVKEWSNTPSQLYRICDNLRERPDDNYAIVSQRARRSWGFSTPPGDFNERYAAWSDWRFICWDLQGRAVADLEEMWPFFVDTDRPYTIIEVAPPADAASGINTLRRAMPRLGEPDEIETAPGDLFNTVIYDTTAEEINDRRGLSLLGGAGIEETVPGPLFAIPANIASAGFTLRGLVYLGKEDDVVLAPESTVDPVTVIIDGQPSFDGTERFARLFQGWHIVEIRGQAPEAMNLRLQWRSSIGTTQEALNENSYFALAETALWRHVRTFVLDGVTYQGLRYDFEPHFASFDGMRLDAITPISPLTRVTEERYTGIWTVDRAGTYQIIMTTFNQRATLKIDGQEVLPPGNTRAAVNQQLAPGDHTVELLFEQATENNYIGGTLTIVDPGTGEPVELPIRPY